MVQPDLTAFSRLKTKQDFDREAMLFDIERQKAMRIAAGGDLPAPLQLANEYQKRMEAGDIQGANLIMQFAKTQDRGLQVNPDGTYSPLPNYGLAVGQIAGQKKMFEANAQNQSDQFYDPITAGMEAQNKIFAEDLAKSKTGLGQSQENTKQILDTLNSIENSPGLSAVVGVPNPMQGRIPFIGNIAGSPAADFQAKLDQLGGKQFLQAFESLKGGGAITEVEGKKATDAIASMQTSQSEESFKRSLQEFKDIVIRASERAQQKAQRDPMANWLNAAQNREAQIGANPYSGVPPVAVDNAPIPQVNVPSIPLGQTVQGQAAKQQLGKAEIEATIFNAKKAVKSGRNPDVIRQRLIDAGIDPAKAGL